MLRWKKQRTLDVDACLVQAMGSEGHFRGVQRATIKAILHGESPVITIMATGGGKSLLFMLPALYSPGGTTIIVVPLIALREDLYARYTGMGIKCTEWNPRRPPFGGGLVLITPESALSEAFHTFINQSVSIYILDCIVIDEAYIILNDQIDFRKQL